MAIYCISDVHGHPKELLGLLDKVSPASDDQIYILGDIVDKGPGTVRLLEYAMREAPASMHFLYGNHEDLLTSYLICKEDPDGEARRFGYSPQWLDLDHPHVPNSDLTTLRSLRSRRRRAWWSGEVLAWLRALPLCAVVTAGDRLWMLVHAGFNPIRWMRPDTPPSIHDTESSFIPYARNELVDLTEFGFGIQSSQMMICARDKWYGLLEDSPLPVVCGHTPTQNSSVQLCVENIMGSSGSSGRICRIRNRFMIDCGCGYRHRLPDWNLAALRLDDGEEFYYRNPR